MFRNIVTPASLNSICCLWYDSHTMSNGTITLSQTELKKFSRLADLLTETSRLIRSFTTSVTTNDSKRVPKDQAWFWSKEWQKKEHEADVALAQGNYKDFDTVEDLIADLQSHV